MKFIPRYGTNKKPIPGRFFVAFLLFNSVLPVFAQEQQLPVVNMKDAVSMTLNNHPELKSLVLQKRVWEGRIQQSSISQRPQISLMVEDTLGTGEHSSFNSMQSTLTFSWLLQQEQVENRITNTKNEASNVEIERQIKALDLSAFTAKQFIEILVKKERLKLNKRAILQAQEVVQLTADRANVGKGSIVELKLAQTELVRRELAEEDLKHELMADYYKLSSLWGNPSKSLNLSGNLLSVPAIPSVASQLDLLKKNPLLQKYASEQRIAQSQMELARIEAKPQWQFTAGVRRYESTDNFGLVAGISIPWGDGSRNAGTISALQAKQDVLASDQNAMMLKLDAQLFVLLQEMTHSQHIIETIQTKIIPNLEVALSEASNAYDKGQLSYSQWSEVRRELLNAQSRLIDSYQSLHLQHIEIQRLTGQSISQ